MAEGAMYYTGPGLDLARRRQEEQRKKRGGLLELLARGVMVPGNVLQSQLSELPEALGVAQLPKAAEAAKGLSTLIEGYEETTPLTPKVNIGPMGPTLEQAGLPPEAAAAPELPFIGPRLEDAGPAAVSRPLPGSAEITGEESDMERRIREAEEGKASSDKRRMLLALTEGLIRGGRTASNVRGLSDILAGQPKREVEQTTADQLAKVRELMGEKSEKALAAAKNPIVDMINKKYDTNFETPEQAREFMALRKTEADIAETEGATAARKEALDIKKAVTDQERASEEARAKLLKEGRLSGLNDKQKEDIEDRRQKFYKNNQRLIENLVSADRGIQMAEDADINGMRHFANAVLVARAQGEVGNLSQTEQEIYRNIPGLEGRVAAIKDWLTSQISQGRIDAITDILQQIKDSVTTRLDHAAEGEVGAFTQLNEEVNPTAVRRYMTAGLPVEVSDPGEQEVEMITPEGEIKTVKKKHVDILKERAGWEERQ